MLPTGLVTKVKQLKPTDKLYRVADHNGLCIEVRPTGTKIWRFRYRFLNIGEVFAYYIVQQSRINAMRKL